jgi:hypothetical protein
VGAVLNETPPPALLLPCWDGKVLCPLLIDMLAMLPVAPWMWWSCDTVG